MKHIVQLGFRYSDSCISTISSLIKPISNRCFPDRNGHASGDTGSCMLTDGDSAPDVTAPNQHGNDISPDFSTPTVVYFYQQDGAPGCHVEAEQFEADMDEFEDSGVAIYGVSTNTVESHAEFADELGLSFDLLADPDGEVANAFGLEVVEEHDSIDRNTFVLADEEVKTVVDVDSINPDGHADEVLTTAKEL